METVKNRRSIRKYAGKPVDEELLRRLLEVSERTQTMGNMQLYSVVVTRSEEMKKTFGAGAFQSAYGDSGACDPDDMCGFQPYGQMGGAAQGASRI